ncbi:hypothetical protein ADK53_03490 [Streptomyces sp. WM6373]|uniref:hypothetical protein n=1 Tax=Streptomyces sp. WM6373 TaxID=1415556 RepID=UPI0006ADD74E|nr:hypothetical protein [Streptomyces sp. WM6373]KOU44216.1 hypothetical protein ADK53_03490 [Streptomyces sp. WM6373]
MLVTTFVVLVLLLIAFVAWRKRVAERRNRNRPGFELEEAPPTFQVVALGLQGSGKTLLLASMYHRLKSPAGQSYFLKASPDDVLHLNQWFSQMADTSGEAGWPPGTAKGETRHFTFTVKTQIASGVRPRPMFHLKYLEYAGELLTEPQAPGSTVQEGLFDEIRRADALIGIIDGNHIRQHLDGAPQGQVRLEQTLNALVPIMLEAECPVSFVITKWDLLADVHPDERVRLELVQDLLTSNDHFRSLVKIHGSSRVVRLIPVSAVGPGFATVDSTGRVVKVPEGKVHPTRVDVPLSAVVPDLFAQVEGRLDEDARVAFHAEVHRRNQLTPLEAVASLVTFAGRTAGRAMVAAFGPSAAVVTGNAVMSMLLDSMGRGRGEPRGHLDEDLSQAERDHQQFRDARRQVIEDMRRKVAVLEDQLPHSRLS